MKKNLLKDKNQIWILIMCIRRKKEKKITENIRNVKNLSSFRLSRERLSNFFYVTFSKKNKKLELKIENEVYTTFCINI